MHASTASACLRKLSDAVNSISKSHPSFIVFISAIFKKLSLIFVLRVCYRFSRQQGGETRGPTSSARYHDFVRHSGTLQSRNRSSRHRTTLRQNWRSHCLHAVFMHDAFHLRGALVVHHCLPHFIKEFLESPRLTDQH